MLTISQLVGKRNYAVELDKLKLWDKKAESVTPSILSTFFQLSKHLTDHNVAKNCTNHILQRLKDAHESGVIRNESIVDYDGIVDPFFSFELRKGLESLPLMQARCVYFALLSGIPINRVKNLTWEQVRRMKRSQQSSQMDAAWDVLDAMPINVSSPLVFWQYDDQRLPKRLRYIEEDIVMAFEMTYEDLAKSFDRMILLDHQEEAEALRTMWRESNEQRKSDCDCCSERRDREKCRSSASVSRTDLSR